MKKRGFYFLITAIPALLWVWHDWRAAHQTPVGYEYSSSVWPIPLYIQMIGMFGMLCALAGLLVVAYDFDHRKTKRKNDIANQTD